MDRVTPWAAPVAADDGDRPRCNTCRFFRARGQRCQRFPPTQIYDVRQLDRVTVYPEVGPSSWCGEYASRSGGK